LLFVIRISSFSIFLSINLRTNYWRSSVKIVPKVLLLVAIHHIIHVVVCFDELAIAYSFEDGSTEDL